MIIRQGRRGDEVGIANLHVHSWQCSYHGIDPGDALRDISKEDRRQQWLEALLDIEETPNEKVLFVAEENGQIIGFICGGKARQACLQDEMAFDAQLYALHVETHYHGRKIGTELFLTFKKWLAEHGFKNMFLWAFADNPFIAFYPKMGGALGKEERVNSSLGIPFRIINYIWRDMHTSC